MNRRAGADSAVFDGPGRPGLEVRVAPLRRRFLRGVMRIETQVYARPWSLGLFMSELSLRDSRVYRVARVNGAVVGYAGLMLTGSDGHITTVAVDPEWRRRGIATRLMLAISRAGVAAGCSSLTLEVRVANDEAQELYRRFGFAPAGVRKNYYAETNEDALIMWAHDVDLPAYVERLAGIEAAIPGTTVEEGEA
ncbi:MAG TPA: ribosomal protein S18-alanine N-acetyltransferase [Acidimicrobiales bacterium]|nr:ribosomal protein S18-alanine N-acetyltransferase [Acidimicrobiales bacterium]